MSRRSKKREPWRFQGWQRGFMAAARHLDPAMLRPRARWRGMLQAMKRKPREPYEMRVVAFPGLVGMCVHRLGSFSTSEAP